LVEPPPPQALTTPENAFDWKVTEIPAATTTAT
jgi:hypothetical protein